MVSDSVLQLIVKIKPPEAGPSNVLSDDPELSWLTDTEYETLLSYVWHNYDADKFAIDRTLALLLSMQYARRPVQLAQLKIGDFRIAMANDKSGLTGPLVEFPGAKDLAAESNFRDSKYETHPLPDHLWNLFELQRNHVRIEFDTQLGIKLLDAQLNDILLFTSKHRIRTAVSHLTDHYSVDWRAHLGHRLFHLTPDRLSRQFGWRPEGSNTMALPISHRTGRPIKVNATRIRHTRARQLARKGVPRQMLSHWLGHTSEKSLKAYYDDPAEVARQLDESMAPVLAPLALAFAGKLIDTEEQASRHDDPTSRLEFATETTLKSVGHCGNHSFCATTSVPVPCYRCKHFEPLVTAPHHEVLVALKIRQVEEEQALRIGGAENLLLPIDLSADIHAVQNCIDRCNARKAEII
ncbi:MAG: integrase [Granulosicoccus sp.]